MENKQYSKCGMRCDLCLIYRPNVEANDRREEICLVYKKMEPEYNPDPKTIICDGCSSEKEGGVLLDPSCRARKCVIEHGYAHCGYCEKYPCSIFPAEPTQDELKRIIDVEKRWTWEDEKLLEAYNCKKTWIIFAKIKKFEFSFFDRPKKSISWVFLYKENHAIAAWLKSG